VHAVEQEFLFVKIVKIVKYHVNRDLLRPRNLVHQWQVVNIDDNDENWIVLTSVSLIKLLI